MKKGLLSLSFGFIAVMILIAGLVGGFAISTLLFRGDSPNSELMTDRAVYEVYDRQEQNNFANGNFGDFDNSFINTITFYEIREAQRAWGDGLVSIATAYARGYGFIATAMNVIDTLYGYEYNHVLFKPTLTEAPNTFRFNWDGAASYFIGQYLDKPAFRADTGFALNPWVSVTFDEGRYIVHGNMAIWMGNVHLTDVDGNVTTVDKTFGYFRGSNGNLRINLHHSSLPFGD